MTENAHSISETLTTPLKAKSRAKWVAKFAKAQILKRLSHIEDGQLTLIDGDVTHHFGASKPQGVEACIVVHDPRFYGEIAFGGSIGAVKLTCWVIGHQNT